MTEQNQNQNQNLDQTQKLNQDQINSETSEQETKTPREYWYQKIARSFPASISMAIGVLVVLALTCGLSAFAGTQAGQGGDNRGRAQIEQFDDRGTDMDSGFDRDGGFSKGKGQNNLEAPDENGALDENDTQGETQNQNDNGNIPADRGSKGKKGSPSTGEGAPAEQANGGATA